MEFTCPSCHTRNLVTDEQARNSSYRVNCNRCGNVCYLEQGDAAGYNPTYGFSPQSPYNFDNGSAGLSFNSETSIITNDEWFYSANDQNFGPFSLDALRRMFSSGELAPEVFVWHLIYEEIGWQPAYEVEFFSDLFGPKRSPVDSSAPHMGHSMISEAFNTQGLAEITARRAAQPKLNAENINALRRKLNSNPLADALRASISSNGSVVPDSPTVPEKEALNTPEQPSQAAQPASESKKNSSIHNLRATRLAAEKVSAELSTPGSAASSSAPPSSEPPPTSAPPSPEPAPFDGNFGATSAPGPLEVPSFDEPGQAPEPSFGAIPNSAPNAAPNVAPRSHPGARRPRPSVGQIDTVSEPEPLVSAPPEPSFDTSSDFDPPEIAKKKKSSAMPILLILLLLLGGGGAAYYFLVMKKETAVAPPHSEAKPAPAPEAPAAPPEEPEKEAPSPTEGDEGGENSQLPAPVPTPEEGAAAGDTKPAADDAAAAGSEDGSAANRDLNGVFQNARFADSSDAPKPSAGAPEAPKVLTKEQALEGIRKVSKSVEACRERFVRGGGEFETEKIAFTLTVLGTGDVGKVKIDPSSLEGTEFGRCINSQRPRWKFFATGGPPQRVTRSFVIQ